MGTNNAHVSVTIRATADQVWKALTDPAQLKQYMMGADVTSDWKEGSPITWEGTMNGKAFKDTGRVLNSEAPHLLRYTHQSAQGDEHTVTVALKEVDSVTELQLTQDRTPAGKAQQGSEKNWMMMLGRMKEILEG